MGKLRDLRREVQTQKRKIERMDQAYERLLRKREIMIFEHGNTVSKLIDEVKLWRDKYNTLRELYDKLKNRGK